MVAAQANTKLYGNPFCRLCEEAEAILHRAGISAIKIDITENKNLFEKYSLRIPVLQRVANDAGFAWPFDAAAIPSNLPAPLHPPAAKSFQDKYF